MELKNTFDVMSGITLIIEGKNVHLFINILAYWRSQLMFINMTLTVINQNIYRYAEITWYAVLR